MGNLTFRLLITFLFFLGAHSLAAQSSDVCRLFGPVYIEEEANRAHFLVYEDESEHFADLVVFEEDNKLYADRSGLWFFVGKRELANFTVHFVDNRDLAHFSVFFTDTESWAGCDR